MRGRMRIIRLQRRGNANTAGSVVREPSSRLSERMEHSSLLATASPGPLRGGDLGVWRRRAGHIPGSACFPMGRWSWSLTFMKSGFRVYQR